MMHRHESDGDSSTDAWITAQFLEIYSEDMAIGRVRSLEEYQRHFVGHERLVEREFRGLTDLPPDGTSITDRTDKFGVYRILREVGRGGQATVYLAEHEDLGQEVALKVLRGFQDLEQVDRFLREARITSRLVHPGICRLYNAGTEHGIPYLAMEYVRGRSLAEHIRLDREAPQTSSPSTHANALHRCNVQGVLEVFQKLARAAHHAHEQGVVHRDLNPNNILLRDDLQPVIVDFGLGRLLAPSSKPLTRSGDRFGTLQYMSPEQVRGENLDDVRIDVWALGVSCYETLTGQRPFDGKTDAQALDRILRGQFTDPRSANPNLTNDVVQILRSAICLDLPHRYPDADALACDLERALQSRPILARPVPITRRARLWMRRNRSAAAAATLAVAAIGTGFGLWWNASDTIESKDAELTEVRTMSAAAQQKSQSRMIFQSAISAEQRGAWSVALEGYAKASDRGHEAEACRLRQARLLWGLFRFEEGSRLLRSSTGERPRSESSDLEALIEVELSAVTQKSQEWRYASLALSPSLDAADRHYARALAQSQLDRAVELLGKASRADAAHIPTQLYLPVALFFSEHFDEFRVSAELFMSRHPSHPHVRLLERLIVCLPTAIQIAPGLQQTNGKDPCRRALRALETKGWLPHMDSPDPAASIFRIAPGVWERWLSKQRSALRGESTGNLRGNRKPTLQAFPTGEEGKVVDKWREMVQSESWGLALMMTQQLVKLYPDSEWWELRHAYVHYRMGKPRMALSLLNSMTNIDEASDVFRERFQELRGSVQKQLGNPGTPIDPLWLR